MRAASMSTKTFNARHSSRSDSWGTPSDIVERARRCMGSIDLDPASNELAQDTVKASCYFTENALSLGWGVGPEWTGKSNVFLNPPGGKIGNESKAVLFWKKLIEEWKEGRVGQAIFIGFSLEILQTSQCKGVTSVAEFPFCIPSKRIRFDGSGSSPTHGNVIVYVGLNYKAFIKEFKDMGIIVWA